VDPDLRQALLGTGIAFCVIFGGLTLYAAVDLTTGLSHVGDLFGLAFYAISFGVIAMIGIGLWGAMKNPPDE
jgi:hypothetical protein